MPPKKTPVAPDVPDISDVPETPAPVLPVDSACAVYRDKSGLKIGGGPSEGASNFGAITAAARSILTEATPDQSDTDAP